MSALVMGAELRKSLTDMVTERQAAGDRCSLQVQAVPGDGGCYVVVDLFDDLAALDAARQRGTATVASGVTSEATKARAALLRGPVTVTLFETLVPLSPA